MFELVGRYPIVSCVLWLLHHVANSPGLFTSCVADAWLKCLGWFVLVTGLVIPSSTSVKSHPGKHW